MFVIVVKRFANRRAVQAEVQGTRKVRCCGEVAPVDHNVDAHVCERRDDHGDVDVSNVDASSVKYIIISMST